jgi:hypothetical protein
MYGISAVQVILTTIKQPLKKHIKFMLKLFTHPARRVKTFSAYTKKCLYFLLNGEK